MFKTIDDNARARIARFSEIMNQNPHIQTLVKYAPYILPAIILLAAIAPFLLSDYDLNLLGRFLSLSILALGLVLIWGHGGILSLGQGVFFGLGGYAIAMHLKLADLASGELPDFMVWSGIETLPLLWQPFQNPIFTLLAIILVPGIFAALFSWLVFNRRVSGTYFALISQALALAFATLLVSRQDWTGGFNGLTNFSTLLGQPLSAASMNYAIYWATLIILCLCFLGLKWLLSSQFGVMLRASRDGENRVRFLGYNPTPIKVVAFSVAAMLAGMSGALFTLHAGNISPAAVGVIPSIEMIIWVALGGRFSLIGAIAGTILINVSRDRISSAFPELWLYFIGALFVLSVTFLPKGLAGLYEKLTTKERDAS
ncbi:urea ABC transporter permease subunit UrtC [Hirschia baltica]|uniref:Urea ABC transporter, permease protein UrtC n=1 Tax=Hirschia baltica (strain ATCC 49814 / DSM 5838 / IFAM 1418) TaxID=582402 RepID=C6XQ94_HIRBI|nr:urea ABC transporter permease subunit UrtC [Hirschia baltica]ACT60393.1 urea ABC transporter, permease protein UrtC [Hirschia baltica ATCC 49814]